MIHNQAKIADLGLALYAKGLSDERVEILEYCGTKGYYQFAYSEVYGSGSVRSQRVWVEG
jgi:hypothetical protein